MKNVWFYGKICINLKLKPLFFAQKMNIERLLLFYSDIHHIAVREMYHTMCECEKNCGYKASQSRPPCRMLQLLVLWWSVFHLAKAFLLTPGKLFQDIYMTKAWSPYCGRKCGYRRYFVKNLWLYGKIRLILIKTTYFSQIWILKCYSYFSVKFIILQSGSDTYHL